MLSCRSRNVAAQSVNAASPVVIRGGTIVSRSAVQQSVTPSAGTLHIQCLPLSASGISVVAQPAGGSVAPLQQIRVLQAASAQPQVVHQTQQYQVIQQQPQQQHVNLGVAQGNAGGITLVQAAPGQLPFQQPQQKVLKQTEQAQIIVNDTGQHQTNYGGVQGVQLAGGIQLQSAVTAQPVVLQPLTAAQTNRNVIVQTVPVVSATNATNVIQLGQISGGAANRSHQVASLNRTGQPTAVNQSSNQNGVLIQIGGQTYRMQGVQQVQVANAVQPTQQVHVQQQLAPAAPSQLSAHTQQVNVAAVSQPSAVIKQLNVATPSQVSALPQQVKLATSGQPSTANTTGQTITLTASQLALLKQTPPEKQMGMIQMFQRQAAQRSTPRMTVSSGANGAVTSPMKTVQIVNSVVSSAPPRTPLTHQTARLSAPTIIRAGPPIAVRVGQTPSSSTSGNPHSTTMQVLRPKPVAELNSTTSCVIGQCHL